MNKISMATMKTPIWITVEDGNVFSGHQGHWANCFFSNAYEAAIRYALDEQPNIFGWGAKVVYEIRPMTPEELTKYPEAITFQAALLEEYGEV